jgi:hypothetical protein
MSTNNIPSLHHDELDNDYDAKGQMNISSSLGLQSSSPYLFR